MAKHNDAPFTLFKRGEIWHARISLITNGRRTIIRESTGTTDRSAAQQYAIDRVNAILQSPDLTHEITLDAAAARWALEVLQYQNSVQSRLSALGHLVNEMDSTLFLSQITKNDVLRFIALCRTKHRSPATINRYLALLSAIFTRAHDFWECHTPGFKLSQFKQREPVENVKYFENMNVINKIVRNAAPHLRPIILTAVYTGLRLGRILSLTWEQVDLENNQIVFLGKNGRNQSVPIVPALADILRNQPHDYPYVFTYYGHRILSIKKGWRAALQRADVPYQSFHTLRHTTATWLLRDSHDLRLVKDVLGHASIQTTLKYAHLANDRRAAGLNHLFDNLT